MEKLVERFVQLSTAAVGASKAGGGAGGAPPLEEDEAAAFADGPRDSPPPRSASVIRSPTNPRRLVPEFLAHDAYGSIGKGTYPSKLRGTVADHRDGSAQ